MLNQLNNITIEEYNNYALKISEDGKLDKIDYVKKKNKYKSIEDIERFIKVNIIFKSNNYIFDNKNDKFCDSVFYSPIYSLIYETLKNNKIHQRIFNFLKYEINIILDQVSVKLQELQNNDIKRYTDQFKIYIDKLDLLNMSLRLFFLQIYSNKNYDKKSTDNIMINDMITSLIKDVVFNQQTNYFIKIFNENMNEKRNVSGFIFEYDENLEKLFKTIINFYFFSGNTYTRTNYFESYLLGLYIDSIKNYYTLKSTYLINNYSRSEYIIIYDKIINYELNNAITYLKTNKFNNLIEDTLIKICLENEMDHILDDCYFNLLNKEEHDTLKIIYNRFCKIKDNNGSKGIGLRLKSYLLNLIHEGIDEIIKNNNGNINKEIKINIFEFVFNNYLKYNNYLINLYSNDIYIRNEFDNVFRVIMNIYDEENKNLMNENMVLFINNLMVKKNKEGKWYENIFNMVKYFNDKDLFCSVYTKSVMKRSIKNFSFDDDEISIITYLKQIYGPNYTNNLEVVKNDFYVSKENSNKFVSDINCINPEFFNHGKSNILYTNYMVSPQILKNQNTIKYNINPDLYSINPNLMKLNDIHNSFKNFFGLNYAGRKFSYLNHLGTIEIKLYINKNKSFIFNCNEIHGLILLMFDYGVNSISFNDISNYTGLNKDLLKKLLQPLVFSKINVLKKTNDVNNTSKVINDDDIFEINTNFQSKTIKNTIPEINFEIKDSMVEIKEHNDEQHKYQLESIIVRLMKSRRTLKHNILFSESIANINNRFTITPTQFKERINSLIEREYIERDQNELNTYKYVA